MRVPIGNSLVTGVPMRSCARLTKLTLAAALLACTRLGFAASCGEATMSERQNRACNDPYVHPDPQKDAVLRLVAISVAIAEEAAWARGNGVFGVRKDSRLPVTLCRQLFQDLISLKAIVVLHEGAAPWGTIGVGPLPNLDPRFRDWRYNGRRQVDGYVVVRWRDKRTFLIRATRQCSGDQSVCANLIFAHLDAHDAVRPRRACAMMTVGARYWENWKDQVTPIELDVPPAIKAASPRSAAGPQEPEMWTSTPGGPPRPQF